MHSQVKARIKPGSTLPIYSLYPFNYNSLTLSKQSCEDLQSLQDMHENAGRDKFRGILKHPLGLIWNSSSDYARVITQCTYKIHLHGHRNYT